MRSFAAGKIDVYFGPTELGAPDDLEQAIQKNSPKATQKELRKLLLAEHAMNAVADWAHARSREKPAEDPFAPRRLVDAAGLAVMFARPFQRDDERRRLDRDEWRRRLHETRADLVPLFGRLLAQRDSLFAHADTSARVSGVTNSYRMFAKKGPHDPMDLRVYDSGAAEWLLAPDALAATAELASTLATLFSSRMVELGAERVRQLG